MLEAIFAPQSVAVIGATPNTAKLGHTVLSNIVQAGFRGQIYPIHPSAPSILGLTAYPDILAVPGPVDLAVIVVPPEAVLKVVEDCGRKGVCGLIVITAGFKEIGGQGRKRERKLLELVHTYNMRMIGPNCLGIIDTVSQLNASFAALTPDSGAIAFMSQSGAICTAILDWAKGRDIGFSRFVSLGNKADVDEVALLKAWQDDPHSRVILAYLEGISNGQEFIKTAQEVTRHTPVIAVKSGTTEAGSRAIASHTGSLAGSERAYEAAFAQSGIIRARSLQEVFDNALLFAYQPQIQGDRIAIVTNAGGPGILAADAIEREGLRLARLSEKTIGRLQAALPAIANVYNPIDLVGDARADRYRVGLEAALDDPNVDGVIVLLTPQAQTDVSATAQLIAEIARERQKPIVTSFMGQISLAEGLQILNRHKIPNYPFPERAVAALRAMVNYGQWRRRPAPEYVSFEVDRERARAVFEQVRAAGRLELGELEAREVVEAYGMRLPRSELARSPDEAVEIASRIGYPVVLKISSPDILHKSDIGGVKVNLRNAGEVRDAFELMEYRARRYSPNATIWGMLVQEQAPAGREVIVGVSRDAQFGPLVLFGLGGIYVEVLKDVSFRLAPLSRQAAEEQIREIRSYPLLRGVRGQPPADLDAAADVLLRISQLVCDFPAIVELDLNPLVLYDRGQGATVLDARIILEG